MTEAAERPVPMINAGSSSVKYRLIIPHSAQVLAEHLAPENLVALIMDDAPVVDPKVNSPNFATSASSRVITAAQ